MVTAVIYLDPYNGSINKIIRLELAHYFYNKLSRPSFKIDYPG